MIQRRMTEWGVSVFGPAYATDTRERCRRFIEEAIELVQATGEMSENDVLAMVAYVYRRPPGMLSQEVAGALLTLGVLSECLGVDMFAAAESELVDLWRPARIADVVAKVRGGVGEIVERARKRAEPYFAGDLGLTGTVQEIGTTAQGVDAEDVHRMTERLEHLESVLVDRWIPVTESFPPVQRVIDYNGKTAELSSSALVLAMSTRHTCEGSTQHVAVDAYRPGNAWLDRTDHRSPYTHWQPIVLPAVRP